jgi:purine-binding chemotaxis protein CheW
MSAVAVEASSALNPGRAQEFLSFTLGAEEYGIDIQRVQELRGYEAVTHIANAPDFIKGVINLRGVIVPIIDLRIRFGQQDPEYNQFTVVVILQVRGRMTGLVVDSVSDVAALGADQIKPAPQFGTAMSTRYLTGIATVDDRMLALLDIEELLSGEELGVLDTVAA